MNIQGPGKTRPELVSQSNLAETVHASYWASQGGKKCRVDIVAAVYEEAGISLAQMVKAAAYERGVARPGTGPGVTEQQVRLERYNERMRKLRMESEAGVGKRVDQEFEDEVAMSGYSTQPVGHEKVMGQSRKRTSGNVLGEQDPKGTHRADTVTYERRKKKGKATTAFGLSLEEIDMSVYGTEEELGEQERMLEEMERRKEEADLRRKEKRSGRVFYDSEGEEWDEERRRRFETIKGQDIVENMRKKRKEDEELREKERGSTEEGERDIERNGKGEDVEEGVEKGGVAHGRGEEERQGEAKTGGAGTSARGAEEGAGDRRNAQVGVEKRGVGVGRNSTTWGAARLKGDDSSKCAAMKGGQICDAIINEGVKAGELGNVCVMRYVILSHSKR